jgi:hypothetical protein
MSKIKYGEKRRRIGVKDGKERGKTVDCDREAGRDKEKERELWCTVFVENGRKSSVGDREGDGRCFGGREKEERKNSRRC